MYKNMFSAKEILFGALVIFVLVLIVYVNSGQRRPTPARAQIGNLIDKWSGGDDEYGRAAYVAIRELGRDRIADDHYVMGELLRDAAEDDDLARRFLLGHFRDAVEDVAEGRAVAPDFILARVDNFVPTGQVMQEVLVGRMEEAITNTASKEEAVEQFFKESTNYTNDKQNVHDSKVNADMKSTLNAIRQDLTQGEIDAALDEIKVLAPDSPIHAFGQGTVSALDATDSFVLACVWRRCDHPQNAARRSSMRAAVLTAINDCVEHGNVVCITGRCARVLGSLALLDYDPAVGSMMTFEALRNQILEECHQILKDAIEAAAQSDDPKQVAVANSYKDYSQVVDPAAEEVFKNGVKAAIDAHIETYGARLSPAELNTVKNYCHLAV